MTQRVALWLAGTMTAFVFVLMGGVGAMLAFYQSVPITASATTEVAPTMALEASNSLGGQVSVVASGVNPTIKLDAQQATTIATNAAPRVRFNRAPELVNRDGKLMYAFISERGTIYVDANSGNVSLANTNNRDSDKHRDEHKEDDDD